MHLFQAFIFRHTKPPQTILDNAVFICKIAYVNCFARYDGIYQFHANNR